MTTDQRHQGHEAIADRLQSVFGVNAAQVADRWAVDADPRYRVVAEIIRAREAKTPA